MNNTNDSETRLIELSRESIETARDNVKQEHWRAAYNRLYYACFYAAKALLETHGYTAETHSGVKTLLSKHFIRTETIAPELGAFYTDVMEARLESDYDASFTPDPDQLRTWLPKAEEFINRVTDLLDNPPS
ncbi:MAG: HEPN domain-containing protein [Salinibacter sp.]|uniref:HEPN domain-containing protein n=1 Tax=Salinibacter sp. TaxID=2065818 RepID=UPI0035D4F555